MSVTITCYGGVAEIGGSKILLEDEDTRLFLDFGIAFGRRQRFFTEFLNPRAARGLLDVLALDLIPPLEGLYRSDLALPGLWTRFRGHPHYRNLGRGEGRPPVDGVLVSHAHLDHNGEIPYLDPTIPIHASRVTAFIARAMQVTGQSGLERELTFINPRAPSKTNELRADRTGTYHARTYVFLEGDLPESAQRFWEESPSRRKALEPAQTGGAAGSIGGLHTRWWAVDHSIPGAMGFAVETSAGWVGYTGDIRFHGKQGGRTWEFARELAALEPVVLLCEGTHLDSADPLPEATIVQNALPLVRAAAGQLAVADFGPRNLERFGTFLEVADQTGRTLVAQPKDVYLLQAVALADPTVFPDPATLPNLALYADPKSAPRLWEKKLRSEWRSRTVKPADVSRSPGDYILAWRLWDLNDLLDLEGVEAGIYLYSNSRAYDDEQAADLERLRNWARLMGLTLHGDPDVPDSIPLHVSGHASGSQLLRFVRTVRPKTLVPIHTEQPGWWEQQLAGTGITLQVPQMGGRLAIPCGSESL